MEQYPPLTFNNLPDLDRSQQATIVRGRFGSGPRYVDDPHLLNPGPTRPDLELPLQLRSEEDCLHPFEDLVLSAVITVICDELWHLH